MDVTIDEADGQCDFRLLGGPAKENRRFAPCPDRIEGYTIRPGRRDCEPDPQSAIAMAHGLGAQPQGS